MLSIKSYPFSKSFLFLQAIAVTTASTAGWPIDILMCSCDVINEVGALDLVWSGSDTVHYTAIKSGV